MNLTLIVKLSRYSVIKNEPKILNIFVSILGSFKTINIFDYIFILINNNHLTS